MTLALDGGGWSSHPGCLYPWERPGTHCTGGWVGPRVGLDRCRKSRTHRDSIPGPSSPQRVAIPTTLPQPIIRIVGHIKSNSIYNIQCSHNISVYWLDYGLDNWGIRVQYSAWRRDFYLLQSVQTDSNAHQASSSMATQCYFPGIMWSGCENQLTTHPHPHKPSWQNT